MGRRMMATSRRRMTVIKNQMMVVSPRRMTVAASNLLRWFLRWMQERWGSRLRLTMTKPPLLTFLFRPARSNISVFVLRALTRLHSAIRWFPDRMPTRFTMRRRLRPLTRPLRRRQRLLERRPVLRWFLKGLPTSMRWRRRLPGMEVVTHLLNCHRECTKTQPPVRPIRSSVMLRATSLGTRRLPIRMAIRFIRRALRLRRWRLWIRTARFWRTLPILRLTPRSVALFMWRTAWVIRRRVTPFRSALPIAPAWRFWIATAILSRRRHRLR